MNAPLLAAKPRVTRTATRAGEAEAPGADLPATTPNLPEVSVSELAGRIKRTIEDAFGLVRLRGEVSNWRGAHSSGHCYFRLAEGGAVIDAVMWKGAYARVKVRPQEGMEVIAVGRITTYPGKGNYQIVVESLEPAGLGALMAVLERRKAMLLAEGLFEDARKRALPFLPAVIGVVTSPTGAVIRDILHRLGDRFPRRVIVWPVRVQGETCGDEVAAAVRGFAALAVGGAVPRPDLVIVARGGGSVEDLWGFNDEAVVRAVAACPIPVISAVGHETDWTLIDMVADHRAPTPSAAAERAVPVRAELLAGAAELAARLAGARRRGLEERRLALRSAARALPGADRLLGVPRQRLDLAAGKLTPLRARAIDGRRLALAALSTRLARHAPEALRAGFAARLDGLAARGRQAVRVLRARRGQALLEAGARLRLAGECHAVSPHKNRFRRLAEVHEALSPERVLERGFVMVRLAGPGGGLVASAGAVAPGAALRLRFADGSVGAVAEGGAGAGGAGAGGAPPPAARRARAAARSCIAQASLFEPAPSEAPSPDAPPPRG